MESVSKKRFGLEQVVLILAVMATTLPVFSGYMTCLFMLLLFLSKRWRCRVSIEACTWMWTVPILVLIGTVLVSMTNQILFSSHLGPDTSMLGGFIKVTGHTTVKYFLLWAIMSLFLNRYFSGYDDELKQSLGLLARALLFVALVTFVYGMLQRHFGINWVRGFDAMLPPNRQSGGIYRISGFTSHPLSLGYQLVFLTLLATLLGFSSLVQAARDRVYFFISSVLFFLTIVFSGSRGPQICVLASLLFVVMWRLTKKQLLLAPFVIGALLLVAYFFGLLDRYLEIFQSGRGGDNRFGDWMVYWTAFKEHVFFGLGPIEFKSAILAYYQALNVNANIGLAHNMYLQVLGESGLVGLFGLIVWMLVWLRPVLHYRSKRSLIVFGSMFLALSLSAVTQNSLRDSEVLYTLTFVTIVFLNIAFREHHVEAGSPKSRCHSQDYKS